MAPTQALAVEWVWSSAAVACTPTSGTINKANYSSGTYVAHRGKKTSVIVLNCPIWNVTAFAGNPNWYLDVTYLDSNGSGGGAVVEVRVMRQNLQSGVTDQVGLFSSNNNENSTAIHQSTVTFSHSFDFQINAYYVQIKLDRSSTAQKVRAYNVELVTAP